MLLLFPCRVNSDYYPILWRRESWRHLIHKGKQLMKFNKLYQQCRMWHIVSLSVWTGVRKSRKAMYVWSVSIKLRGWNGHLLALFPGPSPCSFLSLVQPKNRAGLGMRLGICPLWILAAPLEKILKVCKATHAFTMIVSPLEWFSEWNNMVVTEYPQHIGNPQHNNNPIRTVGSHNNVSHFRLENYHWPLPTWSSLATRFL